MSKKSPLCSIIAALLLLFLPSKARAEVSLVPGTGYERITEFSSEILVSADSSMVVTERVTVNADWSKILHGIYRDFPTSYRDRFGNRYNVGFDLLGAKRDGRDEIYAVKSLSNGKRIYLGNPDSLVDRGLHTYEITYKTTRQLGFFKDHDELYWNATGNGWDFPIENATAIVRLPGSVPTDKVSLDGYTGIKGSKARNFLSESVNGTFVFRASGQLNPKEGLTIVVSWPKGYVAEPTKEEKTRLLLADNQGVIVAAFLLLALLAYYLSVWYRKGRDPVRGPRLVEYDSPDDLSPAALRYLTRMGFDDVVLSASILSLAVKGYLSLENIGDDYVIRQKEDGFRSLTEDEGIVLEHLKYGGSILKFSSEREIFRKTKADLQKHLTERFKTNFTTNSSYFLTGVALSVAAMAASVYLLPKADVYTTYFMVFWLGMWTVGVAALAYGVVSAWRAHKGGIAMTLFSLPFFAAWIFGAYALATQGSLATLVTILLFVGINIIFYHLLKQRTVEGCRLQDRIDGFRTYLSLAEKDRMNFHNPPEAINPETFEKFLPHALALGVLNRWAERFAADMAASGQKAANVEFSWYVGSGSVAAIDFSSELGSSFSSAVSSASAPPGSSSGGGGGGSSGGGGGGGGGGGW